MSMDSVSHSQENTNVVDLGQTPINKKDIISRAYASEMVAMSLFIRWGYDVLQPFRPTVFDFVAHRDGDYRKVQVKSTDCGMFSLQRGHKSVPYDKKSFDYLCGVEFPNVWVIPWSFIKNKTGITSNILEKKFSEYKFDLTDPKTYQPNGAS